MAFQPAFKRSNYLCTIDALCATTHPMRQYLRIDYIDFTRINGLFNIPSSKLLNISVFLLIFDIIGNIIKCITAIQSGDFTKAQENFAAFGLFTVFAMHGYSLARNFKGISKLLNDIDCIFPRSTELQEQMEVNKCHRYIKRRFFGLYRFLAFAALIFCTLPLLKFFFMYDFDKKGPLDDSFHANASWLPFGLKERLSTYVFIYVYEIYIATTSVNMVICWDHVFIITISQLCMYYEYLAKLLLNMQVRDSKDPTKEGALFKQLHLYIYIHQNLKSLAGDVNNIFNVTILVTHAATAISICFNLFLMTTSKDLLPIIPYLLACMVETWIVYDMSKWGQHLETVTFRINEVLYEQKWYESSIRFRKYTIMWMQSTQEPLRLTALNIFNVNMPHFQDIMMLAYQLLTFMKSRG